MGEQNVDEDLDQEQLRSFMKTLLDDVQALDVMLERGLIESGIRRIGAEQEMFLVDDAFQPSMCAEDVLAVLDDPAFTTELAKFNLEANLPPYEFGGRCLSDMRDDLDRMIAAAREAAAQVGAGIVLTGILPTLRLGHLGLDSMTAKPRYYALNRAMQKMRTGHFEFRIKGIDELYAVHDNVMLESCNTSFQCHFQVGPNEFARLYNLAQAVTAPVLAASTNSPVLLGNRLWHETRIALFRQSVDARSAVHQARGQRPRVRFGERWVDDSVMEIFREDIARFRVVLASQPEDDPMVVLERGDKPELSALKLHNGTVYRWNRACYGVADGKAHLRIENRVIPAGPTALDEIANAAFFFGLMAGLAGEYADIRQVIDFDDVRANFLHAARHGPQAQFKWMKGRSVTAQDLILNELLPIAREGLASAEIESGDIDLYLGVLEERMSVGRTGSTWMLESITALGKDMPLEVRDRALTAATLARQLTGAPVHTWALANPLGSHEWRHSFRTVGQFMTTELLTVRAEDLVDLAASLMDWEHIRHVPVEDDDGHIVGIVSHRTILRELLRQFRGQATRSEVAIRDIMKRDPITVPPETKTLDAMNLMRERRVGCLPVVKDGKLVGLVTERDMIQLAARLLERTLAEPGSA